MTFAREALRGGGLTFRPATLDDVTWCARLQTAREPSEPANEEQLRHRWQFNDPERIDESWIIEEGGEPIGYAHFGHPAWSKSPVRGGAPARLVARDARRPERLGRAFDPLEPYAIRDGTHALMAGSLEGFDDEYDALVARGYNEDRRSKSWELDLVANREKVAPMTAASCERMRGERLEITTIDRIADPDKWRKLHELCEASLQTSRPACRMRPRASRAS
ncbi:MAG TPA: hypothetical protein VGS17_06140 [Candidatus Limnocylindria bacterium]|nr:hypothetical protein [Candidatus Limnocylindria bacterium]